ncbi:nucleotidyl transferase AbiEii/AbiGii toxin family protein [Desulfovirgula thermocuniculi]|uniref:nucleotidyl transferase AbiEii/AbiGii toxin family protein n=1 Tax=Desulfovirgula thermocuniculi TaxID=348842 RepID=UPI0003FAD307|nr:nucleotidyl transferase AbiEii/AbiGii toxin family protein [Desulfovirgula thermocuniculi]
MERENAGGGRPFSRPAGLGDLKELCRRLNEQGVRYVLVGGWAVAFHGRRRATDDIDLLVDPAPENVERLREALSYLPDRAALEVDPGDVASYVVVRVADEIVIDLMGHIGDVTYENAGKVFADLEGVRVPMADLDTLIATKRGVRPQDRADLEFLLEKRAAGVRESGQRS